MLAISEKGLRCLAKWEGEILHMYRDSAGFPTIGIGHLLTPEERASGFIHIGASTINWVAGITLAQSRALCTQDLSRFVDVVNEVITCDLTQSQFDALVILAFNIGDHGFRKSTVVKRVNAGDMENVPTAFRMWNKAGGKVNQGLINRRENEIKLWEGEQ